METIFTNIKERILEIPVFKGIPKEKFFNDLGVTYGNFKGKAKEKSLSSDVLAKIVTCFPDIDPKWLLTGQGNMIIDNGLVLQEPSATYNLRTDRIESNIQRVPLYNMEAAAGIVSLFRDQHSEQVIDYVQVPGIAKCDGAIYITGDSMYPLLKSGDIVMYKKVTDLQTNIFFWGQMYLLSVDNDGDDFVVVKYIQKSEKGDDFIKLVSQNQHHDPVDIPKSKINALALIKASIRVH